MSNDIVSKFNKLINNPTLPQDVANPRPQELVNIYANSGNNQPLSYEQSKSSPQAQALFNVQQNNIINENPSQTRQDRLINASNRAKERLAGTNYEDLRQQEALRSAGIAPETITADADKQTYLRSLTPNEKVDNASRMLAGDPTAIPDKNLLTAIQLGNFDYIQRDYGNEVADLALRQTSDKSAQGVEAFGSESSAKNDFSSQAYNPLNIAGSALKGVGGITDSAANLFDAGLNKIGLESDDTLTRRIAERTEGDSIGGALASAGSAIQGEAYNYRERKAGVRNEAIEGTQYDNAYAEAVALGADEETAQKIARTESENATTNAAFYGNGFLTDLIAQQIPQFVAGGIAGKIAKGIASKVTKGAVSESLAATMGVAGYAGLSEGSMTYGEALTSIANTPIEYLKDTQEFQEIKAKNPSLTEQQIKNKIGINLAEKAGLVSGAVGVAAGALFSKADRVLAGVKKVKPKTKKGLVKSASVKAFDETLKYVGEGAEEGIVEGNNKLQQNIALNKATEGKLAKDTKKGVRTAGEIGALAGVTASGVTIGTGTTIKAPVAVAKAVVKGKKKVNDKLDTALNEAETKESNNTLDKLYGTPETKDTKGVVIKGTSGLVSDSLENSEFGNTYFELNKVLEDKGFKVSDVNNVSKTIFEHQKEADKAEKAITASQAIINKINPETTSEKEKVVLERAQNILAENQAKLETWNTAKSILEDSLEGDIVTTIYKNRDAINSGKLSKKDRAALIKTTEALISFHETGVGKILNSDVIEDTKDDSLDINKEVDLSNKTKVSETKIPEYYKAVTQEIEQLKKVPKADKSANTKGIVENLSRIVSAIGSIDAYSYKDGKYSFNEAGFELRRQHVRELHEFINNAEIPKELESDFKFYKELLAQANVLFKNNLSKESQNVSLDVLIGGKIKSGLLNAALAAATNGGKLPKKHRKQLITFINFQQGKKEGLEAAVKTLKTKEENNELQKGEVVKPINTYSSLPIISEKSKAQVSFKSSNQAQTYLESVERDLDALENLSEIILGTKTSKNKEAKKEAKKAKATKDSKSEAVKEVKSKAKKEPEKNKTSEYSLSDYPELGGTEEESTDTAEEYFSNEKGVDTSTDKENNEVKKDVKKEKPISKKEVEDVVSETTQPQSDIVEQTELILEQPLNDDETDKALKTEVKKEDTASLKTKLAESHKEVIKALFKSLIKGNKTTKQFLAAYKTSSNKLFGKDSKSNLTQLDETTDIEFEGVTYTIPTTLGIKLHKQGIDLNNPKVSLWADKVEFNTQDYSKELQYEDKDSKNFRKGFAILFANVHKIFENAEPSFTQDNDSVNPFFAIANAVSGLFVKNEEGNYRMPDELSQGFTVGLMKTINKSASIVNYNEEDFDLNILNLMKQDKTEVTAVDTTYRSKAERNRGNKDFKLFAAQDSKFHFTKEQLESFNFNNLGESKITFINKLGKNILSSMGAEFKNVSKDIRRNLEHAIGLEAYGMLLNQGLLVETTFEIKQESKNTQLHKFVNFVWNIDNTHPFVAADKSVYSQTLQNVRTLLNGNGIFSNPQEYYDVARDVSHVFQNNFDSKIQILRSAFLILNNAHSKYAEEVLGSEVDLNRGVLLQSIDDIKTNGELYIELDGNSLTTEGTNLGRNRNAREAVARQNNIDYGINISGLDAQRGDLEHGIIATLAGFKNPNSISTKNHLTQYARAESSKQLQLQGAWKAFEHLLKRVDESNLSNYLIKLNNRFGATNRFQMSNVLDVQANKYLRTLIVPMDRVTDQYGEIKELSNKPTTVRAINKEGSEGRDLIKLLKSNRLDDNLIRGIAQPLGIKIENLSNAEVKDKLTNLINNDLNISNNFNDLLKYMFQAEMKNEAKRIGLDIEIDFGDEKHIEKIGKFAQELNTLLSKDAALAIPAFQALANLKYRAVAGHDVIYDNLKGKKKTARKSFVSNLLLEIDGRANGAHNLITQVEFNTSNESTEHLASVGVYAPYHLINSSLDGLELNSEVATLKNSADTLDPYEKTSKELSEYAKEAVKTIRDSYEKYLKASEESRAKIRQILKGKVYFNPRNINDLDESSYNNLTDEGIIAENFAFSVTFLNYLRCFGELDDLNDDWVDILNTPHELLSSDTPLIFSGDENIKIGRGFSKLVITPMTYSGKITGITNNLRKDFIPSLVEKAEELLSDPYEKVNKSDLYNFVTPLIAVIAKDANELFKLNSRLKNENYSKTEAKKVFQGIIDLVEKRLNESDDKLKSTLINESFKAGNESFGFAADTIDATLASGVSQHISFMIEFRERVIKAIKERNAKLADDDLSAMDFLSKSEITNILKSMRSHPNVATAFSNDASLIEDLALVGNSMAKDDKNNGMFSDPDSFGLFNSQLPYAGTQNEVIAPSTTLHYGAPVTGDSNSSTVVYKNEEVQANKMYVNYLSNIMSNAFRSYTSRGASASVATVVSIESKVQDYITEKLQNNFEEQEDGTLRRIASNNTFDGSHVTYQYADVVNKLANEAVAKVTKEYSVQEAFFNQLNNGATVQLLKDSSKILLDIVSNESNWYKPLSLKNLEALSHVIDLIYRDNILKGETRNGTLRRVRNSLEELTLKKLSSSSLDSINDLDKVSLLNIFNNAKLSELAREEIILELGVVLKSPLAMYDNTIGITYNSLIDYLSTKEATLETLPFAFNQFAGVNEAYIHNEDKQEKGVIGDYLLALSLNPDMKANHSVEQLNQFIVTHPEYKEALAKAREKYKKRIKPNYAKKVSKKQNKKLEGILESNNGVNKLSDIYSKMLKVAKSDTNVSQIFEYLDNLLSLYGNNDVNVYSDKDAFKEAIDKIISDNNFEPNGPMYIPNVGIYIDIDSLNFSNDFDGMTVLSHEFTHAILRDTVKGFFTNADNLSQEQKVAVKSLISNASAFIDLAQSEDFRKALAKLEQISKDDGLDNADNIDNLYGVGGINYTSKIAATLEYAFGLLPKSESTDIENIAEYQTKALLEFVAYSLTMSEPLALLAAHKEANSKYKKGKKNTDLQKLSEARKASYEAKFKEKELAKGIIQQFSKKLESLVIKDIDNNKNPIYGVEKAKEITDTILNDFIENSDEPMNSSYTKFIELKITEIVAEGLKRHADAGNIRLSDTFIESSEKFLQSQYKQPFLNGLTQQLQKAFKVFYKVRNDLANLFGFKKKSLVNEMATAIQIIAKHNKATEHAMFQGTQTEKLDVYNAVTQTNKDNSDKHLDTLIDIINSYTSLTDNIKDIDSFMSEYPNEYSMLYDTVNKGLDNLIADLKDNGLELNENEALAFRALFTVLEVNRELGNNKLLAKADKLAEDLIKLGDNKVNKVIEGLKNIDDHKQTKGGTTSAIIALFVTSEKFKQDTSSLNVDQNNLTNLEKILYERKLFRPNTDSGAFSSIAKRIADEAMQIKWELKKSVKEKERILKHEQEKADRQVDFYNKVKNLTNSEFLQLITGEATTKLGFAQDRTDENSHLGDMVRKAVLLIEKKYGRQTIFTNALKWVLGSDRAISHIMKAKGEHSAKIERVREQVTAVIPEVIRKTFKNSLSERQEKAIDEILFPTNFYRISQNFNSNELIDLLTDDNARLAEIAKQEAVIKDKLVNELGFTDKAASNILNAVIWQTKGLGSLSVTNLANKADDRDSHYILPNAKVISTLKFVVNLAENPNVSVHKNVEVLGEHVQILSTLHGLTHVDSIHKKELADLIDEDRAGSNNLFEYALGVDEAYDNQDSQNYFGQDGFSENRKDPLVDIQVVRYSNYGLYEDLLKLGYRVKEKTPEGDLILVNNAYNNSVYNTGMFGLINSSFRGVDLISGIGIGEFQSIENLDSIDIPLNVLQAAKRDSNYYDSLSTKSSIRPIIDENNSIKGFVYDIETKIKDKYANTQEKGIDAIGNYQGRILEEYYTAAENERFVKLLNKAAEENKDKNRNYVLLTHTMIPKSNKPADVKFAAELEAFFKKLPSATQGVINDAGGVYLDTYAIDNIIGYKQFNLADIFTSNTNVLPKSVTDNIKKLVKLFGGYNLPIKPAEIAVYAQQGARELASFGKDVILNRSIIVSLMNLASNYVHLISVGMKPTEAYEYMKEGLILAKQYNKDSLRLFELRYQSNLASSKNNPTLLNRLNVEIKLLENKLEKASVAPLVNEGILTSVTAIESNDNIDTNFSLEKRISKKLRLDSIESKLPVLPAKIIDNVLIKKNSATHNFMLNALDYGDFTAKYALYKHLTKNRAFEEDRAMDIIREEFVNYGSNKGKLFDWLNSSGLTWFMAYNVGIQKIIYNNLRKHFLRTAATYSLGIKLQNSVGADTVPINAWFVNDNLPTDKFNPSLIAPWNFMELHWLKQLGII